MLKRRKNSKSSHMRRSHHEKSPPLAKPCNSTTGNDLKKKSMGTFGFEKEYLGKKKATILMRQVGAAT